LAQPRINEGSQQVILPTAAIETMPVEPEASAMNALIVEDQPFCPRAMR
jgi:hypothetical protein